MVKKSAALDSVPSFSPIKTITLPVYFAVMIKANVSRHEDRMYFIKQCVA